jgi:hypothetical protein
LTPSQNKSYNKFVGTFQTRNKPKADKSMDCSPDYNSYKLANYWTSFAKQGLSPAQVLSIIIIVQQVITRQNLFEKSTKEFVK